MKTEEYKVVVPKVGTLTFCYPQNEQPFIKDSEGLPFIMMDRNNDTIYHIEQGKDDFFRINYNLMQVGVIIFLYGKIYITAIDIKTNTIADVMVC